MSKHKVGRNDPCPCGSEKKYKKCCMLKSDNLFKFPKAEPLPLESDFEAYTVFAETWDETNGPVPTFMQFMGKDSLASGYLQQIQDKMHGMDLSTEEKMQTFLEIENKSINNRSVDDFLGLSPHQMYGILNQSFFENSSIVQLTESVSSDTIKSVPAIEQVLWLLEKVSIDKKGVKATQKGNLSRSLAQDFFNDFILHSSEFPTTPTSEEDVFDLVITKLFLLDIKYIKYRANHYSITKKGSDFLKKKELYRLYKLLFLYRLERLNWLFYSRFDDSAGFVQQTALFNLWLLKEKAQSYILSSHLADVYMRAFPEDDARIQEELHQAYIVLFLERFAFSMGLVEKKVDKRKKISFLKESQFKATTLFNNLFDWYQ